MKNIEVFLMCLFILKFLNKGKQEATYHWINPLLYATVKIAGIIYRLQYGRKLKCLPLLATLLEMHNKQC